MGMEQLPIHNLMEDAATARNFSELNVWQWLKKIKPNDAKIRRNGSQKRKKNLENTTINKTVSKKGNLI